MSDSDSDWPFSEGRKCDLISYRDVTNELIEELVSQEILKDIGYLYRDEDGPDTVYIRDIVNVWGK